MSMTGIKRNWSHVLRFRHPGAPDVRLESRPHSSQEMQLVFDFLDGLLAIAEFVTYWRFVVCFTPAFALALFLYFSIPDWLVSIPVAALVLTLGGMAGSTWERTSRSSRRNREGN